MIFEKKPIPGYEGKYHLDPEIMGVVNTRTGRVLKVQHNKLGYAHVQLWKDNKGSHKDVHRMFAEAYIPNPDNLPEVNHKDENPRNFNLDNLEWCDHRYNMNYGTANSRRGANISKAQQGKPKPWVQDYKSIPVYAIDTWGNEIWYPSGREAARQLNLRQSGVTATLTGRQKTVGGYRFRYAKTGER